MIEELRQFDPEAFDLLQEWEDRGAGLVQLSCSYNKCKLTGQTPKAGDNLVKETERTHETLPDGSALGHNSTW